MPPSGGHHEFGGHDIPVEGSRDKTFGYVFAGFFALIAGVNAWKSGALWPAYLALSAIFLGTALIRPALLAPLNRLWTKLGLMLNKIVSPVIFGLIFYLVITPIGFVARLSAKDFLRLKMDKAAASYWIMRDPPGPAPDSLKNQF